MRRIALAAVPLVALAAVVALSARGGQERSQLRIVRVASGLTEPVAVTAPPNEPNNLYVVEKVGDAVERGIREFRATDLPDGEVEIRRRGDDQRSREIRRCQTDRAGDSDERRPVLPVAAQNARHR